MDMLERLHNFFDLPLWAEFIALIIIASSPWVILKLRRGNNWFK
jgi:hypothetical protein